MPFKVFATIDRDGLDGLLGLIKYLPEKIQKKILRPAVSRGSRRLARTVKSMVPVRTGLLKKSLGIRVVWYRKTNTTLGVIGVRHGFRTAVGVRKRDSGKNARYQYKKGDQIFVNPTKYWHLVELGTVRSKALDALTRSLNASSQAIRTDMIAKLSEGIRKFNEGTL
jgi:hypothetical protein